jgi:hypothetical protein
MSSDLIFALIFIIIVFIIGYVLNQFIVIKLSLLIKGYSKTEQNEILSICKYNKYHILYFDFKILDKFTFFGKILILLTYLILIILSLPSLILIETYKIIPYLIYKKSYLKEIENEKNVR